MYGLRVNRDLAVGSWPFLRFMGLLFDLKDEINPVRSIIKDDGKLFISFPQHDGLFQLPRGRKDLLARIKASHEKQEEIAFPYDRKLTILTIEEPTR